MEQIARVYAEALFDVAKDRGKLDEIRDELAQFADAVAENRDMQVFFFSPYFSSAEKREGIERAVSGADVVLLEVERKPGHVVGQLQHLQGHAVVEPVDAGDAVADRQHGSDLGQIGALGVHALDPLAQDARYLVWLYFHGTAVPPYAA